MIIKVLLVITIITSQYQTFAENVSNVAFGKPCTMSSLYSHFYASNGVDGDTDTEFQTKIQLNPWWYVDLGQIYDVKYIEIVNVPQFGNKLREFYIYVTTVLDPLPPFTVYYEGPSHDGARLVFNVTTTRGRYVKLLTKEFDVFHLSEIMVFAPPWNSTAQHLIKPGYPEVMRGRHFVSSNGSDWIFGEHFRPVFDSLMYRAIGYSAEFFADYYINNVTAGVNNQIVYECRKFEVYDNETIFLWAFQKINSTYDASMPSLCDLCSGEVQYQIKLTDAAGGLEANNNASTSSANVSTSANGTNYVSAPDIKEPKLLKNCVYDVGDKITSKGCSILKDNLLVILIIVLLCSQLCHSD